MFPIPKCYRRKKINRNLKWFILWVNSRQYQTERYQAQTSKLLKGYQVWIPGKKTTIKSGDDCVQISEPLFPGYIFVGVSQESDLTAIEALIRTSGFGFYFLRGIDDTYHTMTYDELEKMVQSGYSGTDPQYDAGIKVGKRVRISVGPYTGVVGKVTAMNSKDIRVDATWLKKDLLVIVNRMNYLVLEPI